MRLSMLAAASLVMAAPAAAQSAPPPPEPAPTPAPAPAPAPAPTTGYGSWFGSVPDMDQTGAGIVLSGVSTGSPAAKAGLKAGDVIVEMAGEETPSLAEMVQVLRAHRPGETIEVIYYRGEAKRSVKVTLGVRPAG